MVWPTALRAFRYRDFRLFWTGQLVSLVGSWMQSVGQAWIVLELTHSPFKLGVISALQFGPMLFLSLLAGALADRVRKRRFLMLTQGALMLQALALAALDWSGQIQYWHVCVLALVYGIANTLDLPARQSFVVELVGKGDLMNAIALNATVFNGARIVGPAVAGLLIAHYGVAPAFLVNGLSFLGVLVALAAIRNEGAPRPREAATVGQEILQGLRYATSSSLVGLILALLFVISLFVLNFNVLVPLVARDALHEGARGFGLLMASLGVGAVGGAIVLAVAGFTQIVFMASCNTTIQVTAPDHLRGRVMSLYALVFVGTHPFGALLIGGLAEQWGVGSACLWGGGLGFLTVSALALVWRRRVYSTLRKAENPWRLRPR